MKVKVVVTMDEIKQALRSWALEHGIPVIVVEDMTIAHKNSYDNNWSTSSELKVTLEYEADSLASHEAKVRA